MVRYESEGIDSSIDRDGSSVDASAAYYESVLSGRMKGPQLEGLAPDWVRDALFDGEAHTITLDNGLSWPLLVPIRYNQDYRAEFFEEHFPGRRPYFLSLPDVTDINDGVIVGAGRILAEASHEQAILVRDFRVDSDEGDAKILSLRSILVGESSLEVSDITPDSLAFGMSYGRPRVSHFMATARRTGDLLPGDYNTSAAFNRLVAKGEYESVPHEGPTVLTQTLLTEDGSELLDDIWKIYSEQFKELVEDHPSLQIQPRDELERMLLDDESFNVAYMEEGRVAALCYFVSNIQKCMWLNPTFYEEVREDTLGLKLAYFPGIVVDREKARRGVGYVDEMIKLIERVYEEAGMLGMQIVFQCTNVSETYIPKIVTSVISNNGVFVFDKAPDESGSSFKKVAQYNYTILGLNSV